MGCSFLYGLVMAGAAVLIAVMGGFPSWVIQQAIIMLIALNLFRFPRWVPLLGSISHDVDQLIDLYETHPELLSPQYTLIRLIPLVNWIVLWREIKTMLVLVLLGIPLDIIMEAVETYVLQLPNWGIAATMDFWGRIGYSVMLTFCYTPYLMLILVPIRKMLGIGQSHHRGRQVASGDYDIDE